MGKSLIIFIIFTVCLVLLFSCNDASEIVLTNFVCKSHNETWVTVHVCRLKAINRHKTVLNFNATMHYPAYEITSIVQFNKKASGYKPWLYNITVDICRFMNKPYNPIAITIIRVVRSFSNMNHTCPFVNSLIVSNLHVEYQNLLPLPSGEYLFKIDWLYEHRKQLSTDVYFRSDEGIMKS